MKIKLPMLTMLAGLKRGGAVALSYRGKTIRQEEVPSDPRGLMRITASKQCLTFASGDRNRWISHTVAAGENTNSDNSVEIEQEGVWCFDIEQLYSALKTMGKSARVPGSAYSFEMQYSPSVSKSTSHTTPQAELEEIRLQPCGDLEWTVTEAGGKAGQGGIVAFPADAVQGVEGTARLSRNPPSVQPADEFIWEVEARAIQASLSLLSSVKVHAKHDPAMAEVGLAIRHGCGSFFSSTKTSAVIREITPSEIIGQDKLKALFLFSSDGLYTLASVLAAAKERNTPNTTGTVKMFLLHDQQILRFEIGMTNLFLVLHHTQEKITSLDTIASLSTNPSALLSLRAASSFTVDIKPLLGVLEHALSSSMRSQRIEASLDPKESILELHYAPNPSLRKSGKSMYPASGDMPCCNVQQEQTHQGNAARPIAFSFAPKPVVEFIKASKNDKVTLELLCENINTSILRVRPAGNRKETFVCSLMAK